jgi:hypothetical protein
LCRLFVMAMLVLLAGCNSLMSEARRGHDDTKGWTFPASFTTGDVRVITERPHPARSGGPNIVCVEPSPDVAKAVSTALQLSGQGGNGTVSASGNLSSASAEAVAELAGRSTALLGLRDGLFKACEAYANGIIGDDAYILILSRYGQLMTTLFLAQDIAGATASESKADSPAINPQGGGAGAQQQDKTPANKSGATTTADTQNFTNALDNDLSMLQMARWPVAGLQQAATVVEPAAPKPAKGGQTRSGFVQPATKEGNIELLNHDYLSLDHNLLHLIVVACVNESDETRPNRALGARNSWLEKVCSNPHLIDALVNAAGKPTR